MSQAPIVRAGEGTETRLVVLQPAESYKARVHAKLLWSPDQARSDEGGKVALVRRRLRATNLACVPSSITTVEIVSSIRYQIWNLAPLNFDDLRLQARYRRQGSG